MRRILWFWPTLMLIGCKKRDRMIGDSTNEATRYGGDLNQMLVWTIAGSIIGIGVCVAAMIWTPAKKSALAGIGGFATIIAVSLTIKTIQPYMGWAVLVMVLLMAIAGIYVLRKIDVARLVTTLFGVDMANANSDDEAEKVKEIHASAQHMLGVQTLIGKTIDKIKLKREKAKR